MKYSNNSSFEEVFDQLIQDSELSVMDESNVRSHLDDHESGIEYQAESEMHKSFDLVLEHINEGVSTARSYVSDLSNDLENNEISKEEFSKYIETIRVLICEIDI